MRGLDTNVLIRILTADDPVQSPLARRVLQEGTARGEVFHISLVVLCELVWTLRSEPYRYARAALAEALAKLLKSPVFRVESTELVRAALARYQRGAADFADYLLGEVDRRAGSEATLTFDRRLAQESGFTLVSAELLGGASQAGGGGSSQALDPGVLGGPTASDR